MSWLFLKHETNKYRTTPKQGALKDSTLAEPNLDVAQLLLWFRSAPCSSDEHPKFAAAQVSRSVSPSTACLVAR